VAVEVVVGAGVEVEVVDGAVGEGVGAVVVLLPGG
jgi:hypothetical protein